MRGVRRCLGACGVLLLFVALAGCGRGGDRELDGTDLVVLPPRTPSGEDVAGRTAEVLGARLSVRLAQLEGVRMVPWESSRRLVDVGDTAAMAGALDVDAVVAVDIRARDGWHTGRIRLLDGESLAERWAHAFVEPDADAFEARVLAEAVIGIGRSLPGGTATERQRPGERRLAAYGALLAGQTHIAAGEMDEALARCRQAAQLEPSLPWAHLGMALVYLDRDHRGLGDGATTLGEARAHVRRALEIDPVHAAALLLLAKLSYRDGRTLDALEAGRVIAKTGRGDVEALLAQAWAYASGSLPDRAIPLVRRAIELDPANPALHLCLAGSYMMAGDQRAARAACEGFFSRFGEDPDVLYLYAACHARDRIDERRAALERAVELYGSAAFVEAEVELGFVYDDMGDSLRTRYWRRLARRYERQRNTRHYSVAAAALGWRDEFEAAAAKLVARGHYYDHVFVATGYALLGDQEQGARLMLDVLQVESYHQGHLRWFRRWFDEIAGSPLYEAYIARARAIDNELKSRY